MTERYRQGWVYHNDSPPPTKATAIAVSSSNVIDSSEESDRIPADEIHVLPEEILKKILNHVCRFEGALVMTPGLKDYNGKSCAHAASVKLPKHRHRANPEEYAQDASTHTVTPRDLQNILTMRLVNRKWNRLVRESCFSNVLIFPGYEPMESSGIQIE